MERLWLSIIIMCHVHGQVDGLNQFSEALGMDNAQARRILNQLEERDRRLRVVRCGRGKRMSITYEFEDMPRHVSIRWYRKRVLTFDTETLYRRAYGRPD